jgi:hypothetical protein
MAESPPPMTSQRLVAIGRERAVAHRAGADAALPELAVAGARDVHALGGGAGGDDDHLGGALLRVGLEAERALAEVHRLHRLGVDDGAEAHRLRAEAVGQLGAHDALGEAREVLHVRGGGELATGRHPSGHEALEQHRLELGAGAVDRGGVGGGAAANDDDGAGDGVGHGGAA